MKFKSLTIWTIVSSFLIPIGIGHGVLCVGLYEIVAPFMIFYASPENFSFSLNAIYEKSLVAVGLFALIGHVLLILSLIFNAFKVTFWIKISGLIFLWVSFLYLIHNIYNDSLSQLGFFMGLPFLVCSIVLARKVIKEKKLQYTLKQ